MKTEIAVPGPLDATQTLSRFHLWGEDPCNRLVGGSLVRAVEVAGRWHGYELRWSGPVDGARLSVSVPGTRSARVLDAAIVDARHLCGLDLDIEGFYRETSADPVLGALIPRLHGLRPTLQPRPLEMLVGSVCAQQINLAFAFTVRARLVRRYGTPVKVGPHTVYGFPRASRLPRPPHERRGDRGPHGRPRLRALDGGMVPRPAPGPRRCLRRRRSRRAPGLRAFLRSGPGAE